MKAILTNRFFYLVIVFVVLVSLTKSMVVFIALFIGLFSAIVALVENNRLTKSEKQTIQFIDKYIFGE